jgi:hypothetical protein
MRILKLVLSLVLAAALLVIAFLGYMGLFNRMTVEEKTMGPFTGVYESCVGDYMKSGQVFARVCDEMKKEGVACGQCFGVYYDNPREVPKDKLRSDIGVVLVDKDLLRSKELGKKYKIQTLGQKMSLVTEFPIKNMLSYMIGPMKAYPALEKAAKEKGYKPLLSYEIYDQATKKTLFVMPLDKKP